MAELESNIRKLDEFYTHHPEISENQALMKKYLRKIKSEGLRTNTQLLYTKAFRSFSTWCVKPISALNDDDMYDFLEYLERHTYKKNGETRHYSKESIKTLKVYLKTFLKHIGRDDLAAVLRDRSRRTLTHKRIDRKDLLDVDDFRKMLSAAQTPRDKALLMVLYEAGPRRSEILSSCVCDVIFNQWGCKLTFSERNESDALKTGERTVQLIHSAQYLRAWIEVHPWKLSNGKTDPNAPLWVSSYLRKVKDSNGKILCTIYPKFTSAGIWEQLRDIGKRAGVQKRVNPHSFRHIACTNNAEILTDAQMRQYFGWRPNSLMPGRYTHDPATDQAILKAAGINVFEEKENGLKSIKCPRCSEWNDSEKDYCGRCGNPLKREAITTESKLLTSVLKVLTESGKLEELAQIIKNK